MDCSEPLSRVTGGKSYDRIMCASHRSGSFFSPFPFNQTVLAPTVSVGLTSRSVFLCFM